MAENKRKVNINKNENYVTIKDEIEKVKEISKKKTALLKGYKLFFIAMIVTFFSYRADYLKIEDISSIDTGAAYFGWVTLLVLAFVLINLINSVIELEEVAIIIYFFNYFVILCFTIVSGRFLFCLTNRMELKEVAIKIMFILFMMFIFFLFSNCNNIIRYSTLGLVYVVAGLLIKVFHIQKSYLVILQIFIILGLFLIVSCVRKLVKNEKISLKKLENIKIKIIYLCYCISIFLIL